MSDDNHNPNRSLYNILHIKLYVYTNNIKLTNIK